MDNKQIARVFGEIADLLEIKGENAFKIRAYRSAAETIAAWPDAVARLDEQQLREIPGIGKDLAGRIRELAASGSTPYHQELIAEFPQTILELQRLQYESDLQNAIVFSPEGGQVDVTVQADGPDIDIAIRDHGDGVDPEQIPRLMGPFEQGETALTRRSEGAGLGLPISDLTCKAMDGRLKLASAPGQGLTATVRLPAA